MASETFYFHDYETFGTDPQRDRACQFAGIRTDLEFNIVGEPLTLYCKPAADCLPHPEACLITGITPQLAEREGICEAEFIRRINDQLSQPSTCSVGYNNLRFDDEVTRNLLYRNFHDPYAREWQNGNSRWDLIDVVRAARALRPDGIEWPCNDEGRPSYRLEDLTRANGIEHSAAHDALADVYATIAMARLIRDKQPKLYHYLFRHRGKHEAFELLQLGAFQPVVHISGMYPAAKHCLAIVVALCRHPENGNGVVVYDLSIDPEPLLTLSVEEIKRRLFTPADDLPEGIDRIPLKTVHLNKCPVLAPVATIRKEDAQRLQCDLDVCRTHLEKIRRTQDLAEKVAEVFISEFANDRQDPDLMIYSGGFFSSHDKAEMQKVRDANPDQLATLRPKFRDNRLDEMLFRYKARNYPDILDEGERRRWHDFCRTVLLDGKMGAELTLQKFFNALEQIRLENPDKKAVIDELQIFAEEKKAVYLENR